MKPFDPMLTDAQRFVYHYTKLETARNHILKTGRLRCGKYLTTNDPKERKQWEFQLWSESGQNFHDPEIKALPNKVSAGLKDATHVLCFSTDRAPLTGNHVEDIHKRGFAKPRMWAQYANDHSGVCLVFDRQKLQNEIDRQCSEYCKIIAGGVKYIDRHILPQGGEHPYLVNVDAFLKIGFEAYLERHLKMHRNGLFFEKMVDWRDEAEFRWVFFSKGRDEIFLEFKDSLLALVFGDNVPNEQIEALIQSTEDLGIDYMGLKWRNCSPWYDFSNMIYSASFRKVSKAQQP